MEYIYETWGWTISKISILITIWGYGDHKNKIIKVK